MSNGSGKAEAKFKSYLKCAEAWVRGEFEQGVTVNRPSYMRFSGNSIYSCRVSGSLVGEVLIGRLMKSPNGETFVFIHSTRYAKQKRKVEAVMKAIAPLPVYEVMDLEDSHSDLELRKQYYIECHCNFKLWLSDAEASTWMAEYSLRKCKWVAEKANTLAKVFNDPVPFPENEENAQSGMT